MARLPREFKKDERKQAELWGKLTNRFPVEKQLLLGLEVNFEEKDGLVLLTRDEVSSYVAKAMQRHQQKIAQKLFELTKPVNKQREYSRKSMRIDRGEYLELLYLKILKDTSFSDVLIDVLSGPLSAYVDELRIEYGDTIPDSIQSLQEKIDTWRKITPTSRSRGVQYHFIEITDKNMPFFVKKDDFTENLIEAAKTFGYIDNLPSDAYAGPDPIYEEFRDEWEKRMEDQFKKGFHLNRYIEGGKLVFEIYDEAYVDIDRIKLEELYQKYEFGLDHYLEKYYLNIEDIQDELKKYHDYQYKFSKIIEKSGYFYLGYKIVLAKYYAHVKSGKEFEIQINIEYLTELLNKLEEHHKDILKQLSYYEYKGLENLIHQVMEKGDEGEYRLVSLLFSVGNVEKQLRELTGTALYIIQEEIAKYPVISYYIPDDLAPLLSLVLERNDLYSIIQRYKVTL